MPVLLPYKRLYDGITHHRYYHLSLIILFFLLSVGHFAAWPIVGYDTDLWYHLSGGRYFWQHGSIPGTSFFSFIEPPKIWYDYYWGFQVIAGKVFQWGAYYGLIAMRCLLYGLTVLFICLFFYRPLQNAAERHIGLCMIVLYAMALIHRELLVRPHLFSYFFIVLYLYVLEDHREKIWLLPLLSILWVNIHGFEYPVMLLIVFAYLVEIYYRNFTKAADVPGDGRKTKWLLIGTMYMVFFTPGVLELVKTPFNIAYNNALYQQLYVMELIPVDVANLFVFSALPFSNLIVSFQHFLVLSAAALFLTGLWKRNLRISHIVLFVSSTALLIKYNRFVYEFMLLSMPLVRHVIGLMAESPEGRERNPYRVAPLAMIVVLILIPILIFSSKFSQRPEYPFTQINLPAGVPEFLNRLDARGSVMNEPNTGGYLQWALQDKYKIYMDMQLAIFNDRDFAFVNNALNDEHAFAAFKRRYDPSFIAVSVHRTQFPGVIAKFGEFRPVFLDDAEALYVNALHYPQIAGAYELRAIDPFRCRSVDYETESKERLSRMLDEAMRLRHFHAGSGVANTIIANVLNVRGQHEQALPYAETVIARYPDLSGGYALKGDAMFGMQRFADAAACYRAAIERAPRDVARNVYRNLHVSYVRLKQFKQAYETMSKAVNPFHERSGYREIFELALSAAAAGRVRDAVNFLRIAEMKLPPGDDETAKRIRENLQMLDPENRQADRQ
jgi:tetratricopeptide (TPR) repeat protein